VDWSSALSVVAAGGLIDEDSGGFGTIFRGMTALIAALIIRHSIDLLWGAITVVVTVDAHEKIG
jgi:hypothetical protein